MRDPLKLVMGVRMSFDVARIPAAGHRGHILLGAVIVAFLALAYWGSLSNGFVYDDNYLIVENNAIASLANLNLLFDRGYFLNFSEDSYRPYVTLSYFMDRWIWKLNPRGYHLSNILYHIGASISAYILLYLIMGDKIAAFLAALTFAVHPVSTEAVAAIGFREDLQAAFFYFIAFIFYLAKEDRAFKARRGDGESGKLTSPVLLLTSLLSFAAALASKESAISLPILLAFFRLTSRRWRPSMLRSTFWSIAPYVAVDSVYIFIRFFLMANPDLMQVSYPGGGISTNFFTMIKVVAFYLLVLMLPAGLNADYDFATAKSASEPGAFFAIAFVLALLMIACVLRKKSYLALFAMGWFFITLIPVYNLIPLANISALRYLYLPSLGFSAAFGFFLNWAVLAQRGRLARRAAILLVVMVALGFATGTRSRAGVWGSDEKLWADTVRKSPGKARPQGNLGYTLQRKKALDKAIAQYKISLSLRPDFYSTWFNLGNAFKDKGIVVQAVVSYENSIRLHPEKGRAHNNLGALFYGAGHGDKAISLFGGALRQNAYMAEAWFNLGNALRDKGIPRKAGEFYRRSLRLDPYMVDSMNNLGLTLLGLDQLDEAELVLRRSLSIKATFEEAHLNLGSIYARRGAYNRAIAQYKTALQIRPDYSKSSFNLAAAFEELGRKEDAVRYYQFFIDSWRGGPEFLNLAKEKLLKLTSGR